MLTRIIAGCFAWGLLAGAQVPDSLVLEGVPEIPAEVRREAGRYLEFRSAALQDWHPQRRELLITTRFADATQLHHVRLPGGARRQLTFLPEPVASGAFEPKTGKYLVFSQDTGGGEFYQLFRLDGETGRITLLTDGKSRNMGMKWARSGQWLAYTSTRRNGRDNDIYLMDPARPETNRLAAVVSGGGWSVEDWSADETQLLLGESVSINESYLHLLDIRTGKVEPITPRGATKVSRANARFAADGRTIFFTSDGGGEFRQLVQLNLTNQATRLLTGKINWDVDAFELSPDGQTIAFVINQDGSSVLRLLETGTGKELKAPRLPAGVITGLKWRDNSRELAFNLSSAKSPSDVYSLHLATSSLERWTESETGGLVPAQFIEPQTVNLKSFDGVAISALVYRPDPARFPGRRPVILSIHGGPESQSRPIFQARNNYYLNELGVAVVYPNVRGSSGYGKTFLTLDNGFLRENAVRDIGAVLDWIQRDKTLDSGRVAVMGGSYGGYMTLASLVHYSDRLACGVDVVGISNFLTFLNNTQDYRRDLRRVEYGDERDPKMQEFLGRISPANQAAKIKRPLFVVQGKNDPRVPVTEAEQMVKAIRAGGGQTWYLMAKDEGHGFAKKKNADFQFLATIQFLREHLLR